MKSIIESNRGQIFWIIWMYKNSLWLTLARYEAEHVLKSKIIAVTNSQACCLICVQYIRWSPVCSFSFFVPDSMSAVDSFSSVIFLKICVVLLKCTDRNHKNAYPLFYFHRLQISPIAFTFAVTFTFDAVPKTVRLKRILFKLLRWSFWNKDYLSIFCKLVVNF